MGESEKKYKRLPIFQALVRGLPFKKNAVAYALGILAGHRMKSVVHQASIKLDLCEIIQRQMFLGTYEPTQTAWCKQCLRPGDVFIDAGASFGYYTALGAMLVGSTGRVFAFEPSPVAGQVIDGMIKDSGIQNIMLSKVALGSQAGRVSLFMPTTRDIHSPSLLASDPGFVPIHVPVIALDHFKPLERVARIKLLKMDVEGYEPDILTGMEGLLEQKRIENIICEFNSGWLKRNGTTPKKLHERFLGFGFQVRAQTRLERNLDGYHGEPYDIQDAWFSLKES